MRITCYQSDPTNVVFTFKGTHNHDIASLSDFRSLPISKSTKNFIYQQLNEGYMCRDVRLSIQRQLTAHFQVQVNGTTSNEIVHRDQYLDPSDVYNQYKTIQERSYKRAKDQKESVKIWLQELHEKQQYLTFISEHFENNYTFGFYRPGKETSWFNRLTCV